MGFIPLIAVPEEVFNCLTLPVEVYVFGGLGATTCCLDTLVGEAESATNFAKESCIAPFSSITLNG